MTLPPVVLHYTGTLGWASGNTGGRHEQALSVTGIPNEEVSYVHRR